MEGQSHDPKKRAFFLAPSEQAAQELVRLFQAEYGQPKAAEARPRFSAVAEVDLPTTARVLYAEAVKRVAHDAELADCWTDGPRYPEGTRGVLARWHDRATEWLRLLEPTPESPAFVEHNPTLRQAAAPDDDEGDATQASNRTAGGASGSRLADTDFLSVQEVADICGRSKSRISQLCNEGRIHCRGKGTERRVSLVSAQARFAKTAQQKTAKANATLARDARRDAREVDRDARGLGTV